MYVGSLVESIIPRRGSRFHVQTCVSFIDRVFVCSSIRIVHWVNEWVNVNEWVRVRVCVCGLPFLPSSFSHPQLQLASSWWVGRSVGRNIFNYSHVACVVTAGMMQVVWRVCGDVVLWWWFVCVFICCYWLFCECYYYYLLLVSVSREVTPYIHDHTQSQAPRWCICAFGLGGLWRIGGRNGGMEGGGLMM